VLRVTGLASTIMFDRNDPLNPVNRRISVIVMNKKAEMAILGDPGEAGEVRLEGQSAPPAAGAAPVPAGR
jgi:chemotaxis protein MotB